VEENAITAAEVFPADWDDPCIEQFFDWLVFVK